MSCKRRERFAPSPTGLLHLGHAFSALTAYEAADEFLLRIEDIDRARARPEFEQAIYDDLHWLGLKWTLPVLRQSQRIAKYDAAVASLIQRGLAYACTCTRGDIKAALSAPQEGAPMYGPDGLVYPGTCKHAGHPFENAAIRLDMHAAISALGGANTVSKLGFVETQKNNEFQRLNAKALMCHVGDIVLARRDIGTSYHIAVTVDDAAQGITHVTRGADLFSAAQIHVMLQNLLEYPTPIYTHHRLVRDENGKRLAKRDDARAIQKYRDDGWSVADIRREIGLT